MIKFISLAALLVFTGEYLYAVLSSILAEARQTGPYSNLGLTDALEYWSAYKIWVAGGNPYSAPDVFALQKNILNLPEPIFMWNPPWTMAILSPILQIQDFHIFALFWYITSIFIYNLSCWIALNTFAYQFRFKYDLWIILLSFPPLLSVLYWGQISIWLLLGVCAALTGINKSSWLLCSVAWLLMSFKFHLFMTLIPLFGIYSLKYKENNSYLIKSFIAFLSAIFIFILLNQEIFAEWLKYTLGLKRPEIGTASREWITATIPSLIRHISGVEFNYSILSIIILIITSLLVKYAVKVIPSNLTVTTMLIICWTFPCGAFAWFYDYVCLVPALIISWPYIIKNGHLKYFYVFSVISLLYFSRAAETALDSLLIVIPLTAYLSINLFEALKITELKKTTNAKL